MAQAPTVKIGRRTFTLLFHDLLRPLTESERQALKNSIREYGIRVPVMVDEDDGVIDGANRLQIAAELGLDDVPVDVQRALPHEWKVGMAHDLNDARRHLTPAERRKLKEQRVERIAEARRLGASIRTIAEAEGVSVGQVQRDLKAATVSGDTVEPKGGKVRGKDGKERSATRKARVPVQPAEETAAEPVEANEKETEQQVKAEASESTPFKGAIAELVRLYQEKKLLHGEVKLLAGGLTEDEQRRLIAAGITAVKDWLCERAWKASVGNALLGIQFIHALELPGYFMPYGHSWNPSQASPEARQKILAALRKAREQIGSWIQTMEAWPEA